MNEKARPVAWLHEIKEPEGHQMAMYSQFETNPWSHWVSAHLGQCEYKCSPLYPASAIAALEAERDAYKAQANLYEHMVITCGVAATHSDANLTRTGSYAEKWNSQQAEQVRALRAERDALRAAVKEARKAALEEALIACNGEALEDPTGSADDIAYDLAVEDCRNAIRAIAAKEPNRE